MEPKSFKPWDTSPLGQVDIQGHEPDGRVFVLFREIRNATSDHRRPCGRIEIPSLGTPVGTMESFVLRRQGETGPEALLYDLSAVLRWVNPTLLEDESYIKAVVLRVGTKEYSVRQADRRMSLRGKTLTMEGCSLWA